MVVRRRALLMSGLSLVTAVIALSHGSPSEAASSVTLVSAPIDSTNCFYSNTWMAPRSGGRRHEGVDIIAKAGTPLYAAQRGRVVRSQGSLAGNQAKIVAPDGTYFIYAHLSAYADDTAPHGATVEAGAVIGYVGKTGSTTVNHLHFEVHPNGGRAIDPTPVVAAINTCGTKVAQKAVANPSPWAAVTTTTTPARTTVPKAPTTAALTTTTTLPPTTPATTVAPATTTIAPVTTTVAPTTTAPGTTTLPPTTTAPATTAPTTTIAPAGGSGAKTFAKPVLVQQLKSLAASRTVGIQVVGFPGIPRSATSVVLTIATKGKADGQAAVWPCGQKAGLTSGTPLSPLVAGTWVTSSVTITPGDGGRLCLVSSVSTALAISVNSYA